MIKKRTYRIPSARQKIALIEQLKKPQILEAMNSIASSIQDVNELYFSLSEEDKIASEEYREKSEKEIQLEKENPEVKYQGLKAFYDDVLGAMYRLVVNTSFMDQMVNSYNKNYKDMKSLSEYCYSEPVTLNPGEIIEKEDGKKVRRLNISTSKSQDIVTRDFKNTRESFIGVDEKMQKTAFWANRIAHACSDEVKTFTEQFMGRRKTISESEKAAEKFSIRIQNAYKDYMEKPDYKFRMNYLSQLMSDDNFEYDKCDDPDYLKFLELMDDSGFKCRDASYARNFLHCLETQEAANQAFEIKNQAIKGLIMYLSDPTIDEDEKFLKIYRIRDNNQNDRKGESTSRILIVNKTMSLNLLEFNNCRSESKKVVENLSKSLGIPKSQIYDALNDMGFYEKLDDKYPVEYDEEQCRGKNSPFVLTDEFLTALCEVTCATSFHSPDKALDGIKKEYDFVEIDENVSPIQYCLAFFGGGISEAEANVNKTESLISFLKPLYDLNEYNKSEYKVNELKDESYEIEEKANKFKKNFNLELAIKERIAERNR